MAPMSFRFVLATAVIFVCLATSACGGGGDSTEEIPLPPTAPFTPEQEARIHAIRDSAMDLRGLNVTSTIDEGTLTRDEVKAYFEEVEASSEGEDLEELETFSVAMRMLRIIGPEDDLLSLYSDFWGDGVAGFYSIDDEKLVLISDSGDLSYDDQSTLAHEYVHSFQAAAFDLDAIDEIVEKEDDTEAARTEYGTTSSCLLEGDAELSQYLYEEQVLGPDPGDLEPANPPAASTEPEIPPGFMRYMVFNYNECALWALALYLDGGLTWDKINAAYGSPPSTTEQILHPEKYLAREKASDMPPFDLRDRKGDDWERVESAIFGEFDVYNYVATVLEDEDVAALAAAGWGVGWLNLYSAEGAEPDGEERVMAHVSLEFDTPPDFTEFLNVYNRVIDRLSGRSAARGLDNACWTDALGSAHVSWSEKQRRVDIVLATDSADLATAVGGPISSTNAASCPG